MKSKRLKTVKKKIFSSKRIKTEHSLRQMGRQKKLILLLLFNFKGSNYVGGH